MGSSIGTIALVCEIVGASDPVLNGGTDPTNFLEIAPRKQRNEVPQQRQQTKKKKMLFRVGIATECNTPSIIKMYITVVSKHYFPRVLNAFRLKNVFWIAVKAPIALQFAVSFCLV
ncbi:hypothetical protein TRVL_04454 [Trypanosoma vivax]|uniref:Uncharacterized protein n=1 Tax=Trypanosoma vivax (strain Y486) TaxID=1055687 RepID=G0TWZ7_TRYVY|nr:hypothetical protein TRVL_04454 [Trypanosoma vivax]CCC48486.1 hypothetical protein TVY486_0602770 [Trypanosoma vivax Y486]